MSSLTIFGRRMSAARRMLAAAFVLATLIGLSVPLAVELAVADRVVRDANPIPTTTAVTADSRRHRSSDLGIRQLPLLRDGAEQAFAVDWV